jgi:predicted N-acetyltransferase YhbS
MVLLVAIFIFIKDTTCYHEGRKLKSRDNMMSEPVIYEKLNLEKLHEHLLISFDRYQKTTSILVEKNNNLNEKEDYFIDDWDEKKKADVINDLRKCMESGGIVVAAFLDHQLVGFANVESKRFGNNLEYVEMPYIHVSNKHRGLGIGKKLFKLASDSAKRLGAKKIYIGAHPSIETQQFYESIACTLAKEVNEEIYNREPLDIQLEYVL